jgi:hypothetical protein
VPALSWLTCLPRAGRTGSSKKAKGTSVAPRFAATQRGAFSGIESRKSLLVGSRRNGAAHFMICGTRAYSNSNTRPGGLEDFISSNITTNGTNGTCHFLCQNRPKVPPARLREREQWSRRIVEQWRRSRGRRFGQCLNRRASRFGENRVLQMSRMSQNVALFGGVTSATFSICDLRLPICDFRSRRLLDTAGPCCNVAAT